MKLLHQFCIYNIKKWRSYFIPVQISKDQSSQIYNQLFIQYLTKKSQMPKKIDYYVFQDKISSSRSGDIHKGYHQITGQEVAIKTIKRQNSKGKFTELLQEEIKVLKGWESPNLIKFYDLRKTENNYYLILQYCNGGNLSEYLKKKKILTQQEAVELLKQILNGFKPLMKNNVMHRDLRLENILIHNGQIKVASFGFSKLLSDYELKETMLRSPLNMAPEVIEGKQYTSQADIWSIGVIFYKMLFGKHPYKASNMTDLINNIKNKPLSLPKSIKQISISTEDVVRRMLAVDVEKRIIWYQLEDHPVLSYFKPLEPHEF